MIFRMTLTKYEYKIEPEVILSLFEHLNSSLLLVDRWIDNDIYLLGGEVRTRCVLYYT